MLQMNNELKEMRYKSLITDVISRRQAAGYSGSRRSDNEIKRNNTLVESQDRL